MEEANFSVVIPLYNKEGFIKQTIQSVLNQTYPYFELIIIDDSSTDNSVKIVEQFNDERIRLIHQTNQGVSATRNRGILEANNNYIAFLDADDEWHSSFLEEIHKLILENPNYIAYASNYVKFDRQGNITRRKLKYVPDKKGEIRNYYKSYFYNGPILTSSSICLNKSILQKENLISLFPKKAKRGEDLDAWAKLNLHYNCYFINKELVKIKYDSNSASRKEYRIGESFSYRKWVLYSTSSLEKRFYLCLLAFYKIFRVWITILGLPKVKQLFENYISNRNKMM